jgi:predicted RNase H-like HicB family nuclease
MSFSIEVEQEEDGRWLAEVIDLPGVLVYGQTRDEAVARVQALALRVVAEQLEQGETAPQMVSVSFVPA